ncbi:MAG: molybdate ABC transporter permease subunit [Acidobacteria bacterium]|nr:MAG: molybdate ABC transporter permease subunit [Acidobacteriota bacterium]
MTEPRSPVEPQRKTITHRITIGLLWAVLTPLLILPIVAIFVFAGRGGWDSFYQTLKLPEAQFALRMSLWIALCTSLANAIVGTFSAYVLSKHRFAGRGPLSILVNLPVAIPTVVMGTSLILLWGPIGLLGRYLVPLGFAPVFAPFGVFLAHVLVTFPYMLGAVKPVLDELEITYEEAAYTMGAGRFRTFVYVILPALKGGLFSGTLLTFAHSLGEFGATAMVSGNLRLKTQTAPLFIFAQFEAGQIETANAVAAVLAVLSFSIFLFLLRFTRRPSREGP